MKSIALYSIVRLIIQNCRIKGVNDFSNTCTMQLTSK